MTAARPALLGDHAYEAIREDIVSCRLAPGAEVTEAGLALRLGLGKAPVRTALVRLAQEGLVQSLPRRGYRVAPITLRDIQELFALRLMLEPEAARIAAGHVDLERLRHGAAAPRDGEWAVLKADCDFRMAIVEAGGNRRLAALVQNLMDDVERLFQAGLDLPSRRQELQREHAALVEALAAGDGAAAARLAAEQIQAARRWVMDALMASPALLEMPVTFGAAGKDAS